MYNQGQTNQNQFNQNVYGYSPAQGQNPGPSAKKNLLPWIIVAAEAVFIVVLAIVAFMPKGKTASIADDKTENVFVNQNGKVDAIEVYCETPEINIAFFRNNLYSIKDPNYIVEMDNTVRDEDVLVFEDEDGTIYYDYDGYDMGSEDEEVFTSGTIEEGSYTVDGHTLHLKPNNNTEDYYATYSSHKLTINGQSYSCENYE